MRIYKCTYLSGLEVDLDDPATYKHLPSDCKVLDDLMFKEIGQAICYMDYFHPEIYRVSSSSNILNQIHGKGYDTGGQRERVMELIKDFCENRQNHYNDVLWLQEQVFLIQDETENMC